MMYYYCKIIPSLTQINNLPFPGGTGEVRFKKLKKGTDSPGKQYSDSCKSRG